MIGRRFVTFLYWLVLTNPLALVAQQAVGNPHGDLPDGVTCTSCHTTEAWTPLRRDAQFDHAQTGFPLDGRHADATCARCHAGLVFDAIDAQSGDCGSCHVDVHEGSIARPCESCHTTTSFSDLDPAAVHPADFPLEGAHLQTSCESCHTNDLGGAYRPLDRECASCHMADYASFTLVDHRSLGFSTDCTECHSVLDFRNVAFDHFTVSGGFELMGAHSSIECTTCHDGPGGGVSANPLDAEDCVSCHRRDYDGEHGGSGFPTDCVQCHNPFRWDDASFEHSVVSGGFELTGVHAQLQCEACHSGPDGAVPASPANAQDCVACHQSDYDSVHSGTGFTTNCTTCHNVDQWQGATFDHAFPIYSGAHAGRWDTCADCHDVPGDYGSFTCLTCHTQSATDPHHQGVGGYVYDSDSCLSCHPTGRAG